LSHALGTAGEALALGFLPPSDSNDAMDVRATQR